MRLQRVLPVACLCLSWQLVAVPAPAREIRVWPLVDYQSNAPGEHSIDVLGPLFSWREDEARRRIAAQWPIEEKRARADLVIDTSGTREETDEQVRVVATALRARQAASAPNGPA